jgi:hypothetical protein
VEETRRCHNQFGCDTNQKSSNPEVPYRLAPSCTWIPTSADMIPFESEFML